MSKERGKKHFPPPYFNPSLVENGTRVFFFFLFICVKIYKKVKDFFFYVGRYPNIESEKGKRRPFAKEFAEIEMKKKGGFA